MNNQRKSSLTPIIGIILVVLSAVIIGIIAVAAQKKAIVFVPANSTIPAYHLIDPYHDLKQAKIPQGAVTDNTLTPAKLDAMKAKKEVIVNPKDNTIRIISQLPLLSGNPVDVRTLSKGINLVSADEELVGVTTDIAGSVAGVPGPGSVVDVSLNGATAAEYAKVVCAGAGASACDAINLNQTSTASSSGSSSAGKSTDIFVVLAVPKDSAGTIAGSKVALAYHPGCRVDDAGHILAQDVGVATACTPPAGRAASTPAAAAPATPTTTPAVP